MSVVDILRIMEREERLVATPTLLRLRQWAAAETDVGNLRGQTESWLENMPTGEDIANTLNAGNKQPPPDITGQMNAWRDGQPDLEALKIKLCIRDTSGNLHFFHDQTEALRLFAEERLERMVGDELSRKIFADNEIDNTTNIVPRIISVEDVLTHNELTADSNIYEDLRTETAERKDEDADIRAKYLPLTGGSLTGPLDGPRIVTSVLHSYSKAFSNYDLSISSEGAVNIAAEAQVAINTASNNGSTVIGNGGADTTINGRGIYISSTFDSNGMVRINAGKQVEINAPYLTVNGDMYIPQGRHIYGGTSPSSKYRLYIGDDGYRTTLVGEPLYLLSRYNGINLAIDAEIISQYGDIQLYAEEENIILKSVKKDIQLFSERVYIGKFNNSLSAANVVVWNNMIFSRSNSVYHHTAMIAPDNITFTGKTVDNDTDIDSGVRLSFDNANKRLYVSKKANSSSGWTNMTWDNANGCFI